MRFIGLVPYNLFDREAVLLQGVFIGFLFGAPTVAGGRAGSFGVAIIRLRAAGAAGIPGSYSMNRGNADQF
jgi:hypothetical protein